MVGEVLELDKVITTAEALDIVRKKPHVTAIQLPESQAERLSQTTIDALESHGVFLIKKSGGLGRPKFVKSERLIEDAQNLKDSGVGLTKAAEKLGIPESTLYVHIWKQLK